MTELKPHIKSWLLQEVYSKNVKGPDVLEMLKEKVATREDIYRDTIFWIPYGPEKSRAPVGKEIEQMRAEREKGIEKRKKQSEPVESGFAEISDSIKEEIIQYLKSIKMEVTGSEGEKNILQVYEKNKDKFTEDIGRTF